MLAAAGAGRRGFPAGNETMMKSNWILKTGNRPLNEEQKMGRSPQGTTKAECVSPLIAGKRTAPSSDQKKRISKKSANGTVKVENQSRINDSQERGNREKWRPRANKEKIGESV